MMSLHSRSGGDLLQAAPGTLPERLSVIPGRLLALAAPFLKRSEEMKHPRESFQPRALASVPTRPHDRNTAAAFTELQQKRHSLKFDRNKLIAQRCDEMSEFAVAVYCVILIPAIVSLWRSQVMQNVLVENRLFWESPLCDVTKGTKGSDLVSNPATLLASC